ncbi:inositol 1,4,5-trisphosphate receptor-interacting protein [Echeneis naucrates]|uniref:Inositol 1,4,5-trisphosphate receptor-interacting protein n=1 Tax=Echeneis naucrates TaxID=173247 RepID=A0A665XAM9_ECHNA|nr:inositol 1,4,5-trisphosphate receptor-interacting protein [Echeneis naucrates]
MQGAIARVCVVMAAAILNHPLLFPEENTTLEDMDEELMARMREHEVMLEMEKAKLERDLSQLDSKPEEPTVEGDYTWYFWSAASFIIFFTIEMCRMDLTDTEIRPAEDEDIFSESGFMTAKKIVLDKNVLSNFCDKCTHTLAHENWRVREFAEGFTDDLLESLRSTCDMEVDMEVGDFIGIGSMFESWKVCKPLTCDIIVPFTPPDPYSFQFQLWCSPNSDMPPDMQGFGKIQVTRLGESEEGCLCGSANLGEDMLCLLHGITEDVNLDSSVDELLCSKDTPLLAKDQIMKWFQISVTKAWGKIYHKYNFELTFRNLDAAGALKIRFRSGKVIMLNLIPVVQLKDTDAYFVSHYPSDYDSSPDTHWALSFAVYERNLLKHLTKLLPQNSCHLHCLQIITFLNRKQMGLTGRSALTNYHIKTALLHLLLCKRPSAWGVENTESRLREVLAFLQRSLQEKRLHHVLIGNNKVPEEIQIPKIIRKAEPMNLFRSLVLQAEFYDKTVRHFQEMLRNASVLIQEYTPDLLNGGLHHS